MLGKGFDQALQHLDLGNHLRDPGFARLADLFGRLAPVQRLGLRVEQVLGQPPRLLANILELVGELAAAPAQNQARLQDKPDGEYGGADNSAITRRHLRHRLRQQYDGAQREHAVTGSKDGVNENRHGSSKLPP